METIKCWKQKRKCLTQNKLTKYRNRRLLSEVLFPVPLSHSQRLVICYPCGRDTLLHTHRWISFALFVCHDNSRWTAEMAFQGDKPPTRLFLDHRHDLVDVVDEENSPKRKTTENLCVVVCAIFKHNLENSNNLSPIFFFAITHHLVDYTHLRSCLTRNAAMIPFHFSW